MIKSFKHKGLEKFALTGSLKGIKSEHARKLIDIISMLNAAKEIKDMDFPGSYLHELKGERRGTWSVKVNKNWRITFKFQNEYAYDVNYEDYH